MKKQVKRLFSIIFFGLIGQVTFAQGVTTSNMSGTVVNEAGNPLVGADVVAVHEPSGSVYGATTNSDGVFNVIGLRPGGPYKVSIQYMGYASKTTSNIRLQLGQTFQLNAQLMPSSIDLQEVEVKHDRNALFSSDRMGVSVNLDANAINDLPTINRSIDDFTRLTPQSNGTSFAGRDNRFNNYTVDGNIYNNNFGLGSGQFAGTNPISIDAIEEVQVNLTPFDVREAGFTGANVNAITRSGSNTTEASAYSFFRNQSLIGATVAGNDLVIDDSRNRIIGARVGGPIIKNKLFYFLSAEYEDELNPGDARRAARPGLEPDGLTISRVPADQLDDVRANLLSLYGYDAGDYENKTFSSNAMRFNLRFDYNINKRNKAFVRMNHFRSSSDIQINGNSLRYLPGGLRLRNTDRFGVEAMNFRNSDYSTDRNITSVVGELNSALSSNLSNTVNVGFTSITDPKRGIPGGQVFPFIEVLEPDASGNLLYYMSMGNELFSVGNLLENRVFNITDNLTYYSGKHTVTAGFNFEYMTFQNAFNPVFNGFYRYNSFDNFYRSVIQGDASVRPDAFAQGFAFDGSSNPPVDEIAFSQVGVYLQDKFKVNNKFTVTAGLRVDMPFYPSDLPRNERLEEFNVFNPITRDSMPVDVSQLPGINPIISPRLGFNWSPLDDNKLQIRGGAGIFSGRFPFVWVSNQVNANGVTRGGYGISNPNQWGTNNNPEWDGFQSDVTYYRPDTENLESQVTRAVNLTDQNFKLPTIFRSSLAADYDLGNNFFFTVEGIYSRDINTPISVNVSLSDSNQLNWNEYGGNGDTRGYWANSSAAFPGQFNDAFLLTNAQSNGDYYALTAQMRKDFYFSKFLNRDHSLSTMVAYTRSRARDYGLEGGSQAASLWSIVVAENRNDPEISFTRFDQPNRLLANVTYKVAGLTASVLYIGGEAGRYSYTYSGNIGDGQQRLMYIPNSASEVNLIDIVNSDGNVVATAAQQWAAIDDFISQDKYLSANRGSIAERNGALLPWLHRFDLRFMYDIKTDKNNKHKFQLTFDVLNFGNLINNDWGVQRIPTNRQLLQYRGVDANGAPQFTANFIAGTTEFPETSDRPIFDISQVWSAQIGLRYIFN